MPPLENIHGWSAAKVQARQQATAQALNLPVSFRHQLSSGGQGPDMVVIPAGRFFMGSPESEAGRDNDERQHQVTIERPFAIGRYAVTRGEFARFVQATKYRMRSFHVGRRSRVARDWRHPGFEQGDDHPVVGVSYWDALAYGDWLAQQTGRNYRLPTEAEWEYACRAGTPTPFSFGENITPEQVNYDGRYGYQNGKQGLYREQTVEVGSLPANPWGLYEMHGNVWEWTGSAYAEGYDGSEIKLSSKNDATALRVYRGGSWNNGPAGVRSAIRNWDTPDNRDDDQGFRLAQDI